MVFGSFLALASEKNSARFENFVVVQHFNDSSDVIVFVLGILAQFVPPSAPQNLAPFNLSNRAEVAVVGFGVVGRCLCVEGIFQLQPKCVCLAVGLGVRYPQSSWLPSQLQRWGTLPPCQCLQLLLRQFSIRICRSWVLSFFVRLLRFL